MVSLSKAKYRFETDSKQVLWYHEGKVKRGAEADLLRRLCSAGTRPRLIHRGQSKDRARTGLQSSRQGKKGWKMRDGSMCAK